jgi:hypothetical protein
MARKDHRPDVLEGAPLHYAPVNEQGVVFLFSHLAKRFRMRVEEIRQGLPDCVAYEKTSTGERKVRIEFEHKSSSFKTHRHPARGCDCIVCWEHDWPDCPKRLRVIELRKEYGLGFKIWMQPAVASEQYQLDEDRTRWLTRRSAHIGDLMVMYRCVPEKCIRELFVLSSLLTREHVDQTWKHGIGFFGDLRCVCRLESPVFLEDMQSHRILRTSGFIRGNMQGNRDVTQYWPHLYDLIVKRNPKARLALQKYSPERLDIR